MTSSLDAPPMFLDADLSALNTFGLPGRARRLVCLQSIEQVHELFADASFLEGRVLVLGGGSNLILNGEFDGTVLKVEIGGRGLVHEDEAARVVEAGAGENWHAFVRWTLDQGWPGLENLSLIPGTVGAAPIQNIGAYGLEMAERFAGLDAVDMKDGSVHVFGAERCRFGYRDSVFKQQPGRWLVTRVRFRLPRAWTPLTRYAELERELGARGIGAPTALEVSDAVIAIRQRKLPDPAVIGNAGSFFKNPVVAAADCARLLASHPAMPHYPQADGAVKLAAGWLIEQAGWKGRDLGPVGCYERQALVLVNRGGATGADVARIASAIGSEVLARFGVVLEPEPVFV